jgi:hypothetical protein
VRCMSKNALQDRRQGHKGQQEVSQDAMNEDGQDDKIGEMEARKEIFLCHLAKALVLVEMRLRVGGQVREMKRCLGELNEL